MDYLVIADDGTEYGPATLQTLSTWVSEGRVHPTTRLKNFQSGAVVEAGSVAALFPAAPPVASRPGPAGNPYANPPTNYPRSGVPTGKVNDGTADVWWAIGRAIVAVLLAVLIPRSGLFTGAYGIWRGVRAYQSGHRLGLAALIISIVAMVIVGGLAVYGFTHMPSYGYRSPDYNGNNQ